MVILLIFLCIKIFFARLFDVSIGTVRTVLMVRGKSFFMSFLAFIEVFIWFIVAREALNTEVQSILIPFFYAFGYATGTLIGSFISHNFIKEIVGVQVVTNHQDELLKKLKSSGYGYSVIELKDEKRDMLYFQIKNSNLKSLIRLIKEYDNKAFIVVSETKSIQNGFIK